MSNIGGMLSHGPKSFLDVTIFIVINVEGIIMGANNERIIGKFDI